MLSTRHFDCSGMKWNGMEKSDFSAPPNGSGRNDGIKKLIPVYLNRY